MTEVAPQFYTDPVRWAEEVVGQYGVHIHTFSALETLVVSDVDDTLVDSNGAWHEAFTRLATEKGFDPDSLPDAEAFEQRRPSVCFTELGLVEDYPAYKAEQMHNVAFHAGMKALADAAEVLPGFLNLNLPGAYLSTRPDALGGVTKWHLQQLGFARAPLLVRPKEIPYDKTIEFKVTASQTLRRAIDEAQFTDVPLKYIDDYAGAVNAINALGHPGLVGTHFGRHTSWREITQRIMFK